MKILIISFTFPPNKDGVSEAASAMAKGFCDRGWEVSVLTRRTNPPRNQTNWNGANITEFEYGGTTITPEIVLQKRTENYAEFLTGGAWDAIILHAYEATLHRAIPVLDQIKARKILVSHGYAALIWEGNPRFPYGIGSWLRRVSRSFRMFSWLHRFDRVVYLSETADFHGFYDHLIAKTIGYKGRRVIPNGIDLNERGNKDSDFRARHGIPSDSFVFLCVANYSPRKDQGYGASAFRKAAIPGSVLIFIGSDFNEHSKKFQDADASNVVNSPPGKIIWLEKQDRRATLDALATCNAFLLSAYHEAQPISLLEAMREGKPWVARNAGCIASMEGGLCVYSEQQMAEAMQGLTSDPGLCERLGSEGSHAVSVRYNRDAYVDSYCKLLEELVAPVPES
ncbi:MAG: glycosyltransferase family 4 protein [Armatimonadetes bacterium]|nr:glycosyltransferase family 4 protein [Akkermansiaceae bacterium]